MAGSLRGVCGMGGLEGLGALSPGWGGSVSHVPRPMSCLMSCVVCPMPHISHPITCGPCPTCHHVPCVPLPMSCCTSHVPRPMSCGLICHVVCPVSHGPHLTPHTACPCRHERAQLTQPQHLPHQHQAGERGDGAEAQREALPGRPGRQREGAGGGPATVPGCLSSRPPVCLLGDPQPGLGLYVGGGWP